MLRDVVGDEALSAALRAYNPAEDARSGSGPSVFQKLLEQAGVRRDLSWFFSDWVNADKGLPDLTVEGVFPSVANVGNWLVSVNLSNAGYAACEVPVTVRSEKTSVTQRMLVPAHGKAVQRILIQGKLSMRRSTTARCLKPRPACISPRCPTPLTEASGRFLRRDSATTAVVQAHTKKGEAWGLTFLLLEPCVLIAFSQYTCSVEWRARWLFLRKKPLGILPSLYTNWKNALAAAFFLSSRLSFLFALRAFTLNQIGVPAKPKAARI